MFRQFLYLLIFGSSSLFAQADLQFVHLSIVPDFEKQSIRGTVNQTWLIHPSDTIIELELFPEFDIQTLKLNNKSASYIRKENAIIIPLKEHSSSIQISIQYSGIPHQAVKPPWDGGFIWKKDANKQHWLTVACQDEGAQLWWPAPANYSDEPESALITCTYPDNLFFKSNGKLFQDRKHLNNTRTTTWKVSSPINTYNITLNIGNYAQLSDTLLQANGKILQLNYYPLAYNKDKALKQFTQVKPMLRCFESYFGPYPFFNDGYSIVETPYAGMEHQSAIAYGNGYVDGYNGKDYSAIDVWFDFIVIHETGHEWWGNSVTAASKKDFWLQEAFCTYAEYVYVKCRFGNETAERYINAKKRLVSNKSPIMGEEESGVDMYTKGALMIHTMQQFASSEEEWWKIMKEFALEFRWKSITSDQLKNWFSMKIPGLEPIFFDQYLTLANPPILEYKINGDSTINFRISNALQSFKIPIQWQNKKGESYLTWAGGDSQTLKINGSPMLPNENAAYFILKTR